MEIGDLVTTTFTGKVTTHRIIAMTEVRNSQSGVCVRVDPPLRTWRDWSNPYDAWPNEVYDVGWFEKIDQGELFP